MPPHAPRILLAAYDADFGESVAEILADEGCVVEMVSNAVDARESIKRTLQLHALVTDWTKMGTTEEVDAMYQAAHQKGIPVVVMNGGLATKEALTAKGAIEVKKGGIDFSTNLIRTLQNLQEKQSTEGPTSEPPSISR